jgi:hypothetical protein
MGRGEHLLLLLLLLPRARCCLLLGHMTLLLRMLAGNEQLPGRRAAAPAGDLKRCIIVLTWLSD